MAGTDRSRAGAAPEPGPVILLVETQLGENIGAAARAMLNFGLVELRLVRPQCGWPNAKALAACSGASEVLNHATLHETLAAATADLHHLVATTARPRELAKPVADAADAAVAIRAATAAGLRVGVLFGPERTGLANDDLLLADSLLTVPVNPAYASLNLAQAVLLVGYEWHKAADAGVPPPSPAPPPASKAELRGLLDHLTAELDRVDFFRTADRRTSMLRQLETALARAGFLTSEIQLLRGIVKELARGGRTRRT
jgi:tRNA/rRNA methyltransferase